MTIVEWMALRDGVVRTAALRRAGFKNGRIAQLVSEGALTRPRQGWVALRGADPHLIAAARAGVVISCVTQAHRLGLWVLSEHQPHVAAPRHSSTMRAQDAVVHWSSPLVPRHPDALVDGVENVLHLIAACQPYEAALAVWESALNKGMVERSAIARLPLRGAAKELCAAASPYSDSGLESFVPPRLRWLGLSILAQAYIAGRNVDFLIGDRLVLQIDGGHHVGVQRTADIEHDARLMLSGYHVIRVGYEQVVDRWHTVQELIMHAVAQGLHRAS